jgi:phosphohistidine swiveling domain-containing protein
MPDPEPVAVAPNNPQHDPGHGDSGPMVLAFDAIDDGMIAAVGGKAANLGRMSRAGLPVPPGFCLTTRAYRLASGDVLASILDQLAAAPASDQAGLAVLATQARSALLAAPMPAEVAQALTVAHRALAGGHAVALAVRSSATAEDLPFASFAGQQDTYLNMLGLDAVLDAVHRCWASLWTERAVLYRASNGIDHRDVRLAVVVQQLVDSAVAGVMFTANPVTGTRGQTVIDASPGLGEAVVSGAVNPDHFVVDSARNAIVERRLGDKRLVVRATAGGGTSHVTREGGDPAFCLSDDQVGALVELGRRVTAHYGSPQDTEWAVDPTGALWLTQARPITTLFPLPWPEPVDQLRVYFCFSVAQGLTRPLTPMGLSVIRVIGTSVAGLVGIPVADPVAGPPMIGDGGGRLFLDVTMIMRSRVGRWLAPKVLDVMEARSAVVLRRLFDDPRLSVVHTSRRPVVRRLLRIAARYRLPLLAAQAVLRPDAALRRMAALDDDVRRRTTPPDGATAAERLQFVIATVGETIVPLLPRIFPVAGVGFGLLGLAGKLLGADAAPGELQGVLRSLPHNVTTEMDLDLWGLATSVRADPRSAEAIRSEPARELASSYHEGTLPSVLQRGLADFLDRYGHRAVAEIDIGMPRWSEDPTQILGVLANYLRLDDQQRAPDAVFARGAAEAEALVTELTARARRRGRLRGRVVGLALRRARDLTGVRELPKYYLVLVLARLRSQLVEVGAELAGAGRLADPDDVFHLDLREAAAGLAGQDLTGLVDRRRARYDQELRRRHVPRVLLSDGTEPEAQPQPSAADAQSSTDGALTGTPASAGIVTGLARVVLEPVGARLEPGEILVAPSTDPGWTPLFLTAGGLVMEMGGANSHGAVVAREYGIPAVVGVTGATIRLATGQQITVDGSSGRVTPNA